MDCSNSPTATAGRRGPNIETAGVHLAMDELSILRRQLAALELEDAAPPTEVGRPLGAPLKEGTATSSSSSPLPPTDVAHIAASLEMAREERMLQLRLDAAAMAEQHRAERNAFFNDEDAARQRLDDYQSGDFDGIATLFSSDHAIATTRLKRRQYEESKLAEVAAWQDQHQQLEALDQDFLLHDRERVEAIMQAAEVRRQAEEDHWRRRREAERQLMFYADEDDLFTQDHMLSRLGLVRASGGAAHAASAVSPYR